MSERYTEEVARMRHVLRRFVVIVVLVDVILIGSVWAASFVGFTTLVDSLRQGCVLSRERIHLLAAQDSRGGEVWTARGLDRTIPASCARAYPDPGPFALGR